MDVAVLRKWLAEPRTALVAAVAEGVRDHVASLKSRGVGFYGFMHYYPASRMTSETSSR